MRKPQTIIPILRELNRQEMTRVIAAQRCNMNYAHFCQIVQGRMIPTKKEMERISIGLDKPVKDLFREDE